MKHAFAARATRVVGSRQADQAAGLATDRTRYRVRYVVRLVLLVEPLPDLFAVERRIEPYQNDRQSQERVDAGLQPDLDQATELDIGDKDAEHEHLDH